MRKLLCISMVFLMVLSSFIPLYAEGPDNSDLFDGHDPNDNRYVEKDPISDVVEGSLGYDDGREEYDYQTFGKWTTAHGLEWTDEDYKYVFDILVPLDRRAGANTQEEKNAIAKEWAEENEYIVVETWELNRADDVNSDDGVRFVRTIDTKQVEGGRTIYRNRVLIPAGSNKYRQLDDAGYFKFITPDLLNRYTAAWAGLAYNSSTGERYAWNDFEYCLKGGNSKQSVENQIRGDKCYTVAQGSVLLTPPQLSFDVVIVNPETDDVPEEERGIINWVSGFDFKTLSRFDDGILGKDLGVTAIMNALNKYNKQYSDLKENEDYKLWDVKEHFARAHDLKSPYYLDLRNTDQNGNWVETDKDLERVEKYKEAQRILKAQ